VTQRNIKSISAVAPSGKTSQSDTSAAQRVIAVIGDTWTLRILRTVFRGKRRYGDFVSEFGVSRAVLTDRLEKLVKHQVLERHSIDGRHPEYRLTERGLDLWSLFLGMWQWESDWGTARAPDTWAPDLPRSQVSHTDCDHAMQPQLRCHHCHGLIVPFETVLVPAEKGGPTGTDMAASSGFRRARNRTDGSRSSDSQRLVRVIGDRWNSAVVAAAFRGTRTFSGFEQELKIGPAQLSDRLAELQKIGILRARAYAGARHEYRLTGAAIALFPVILEMVHWGNRWLTPKSGHLRVRHLTCNHLLDARWHCSHCEQELTRESVRFS
jgi:DNA-binding HxlR family transcriptional regulator